VKRRHLGEGSGPRNQNTVSSFITSLWKKLKKVTEEKREAFASKISR
jgi:hypothetical protein